MLRTIDLSGQKFGYLTVLQSAVSDKNRNPRWHCLCDCGKEIVALGSNLKRENTKSCGCMRREKRYLKDLTRQRFGRLVVLQYDSNDKHGSSMWQCRCDCGNHALVRSGNLLRGIAQSCGCKRRNGKAFKHGHNRIHLRTSTYQSWDNMIQRCTNSKASHYDYYGGRGIRVHDAWLKFENFLFDMGERPEGTTLDRIDNNGNYEPGNCRWATWKQQRANKRRNNQFTKGRN